jgi:hypothetical protein
MSEIRFVCPFCSQHLACDDVFCDERIICPACKKELLVPAREAFTPPRAGGLAMALPVASAGPPAIPAGGIAPLAQNKWGERASHKGSTGAWRLLPLWILLFLPFVLALIFVTHRGGLVSIEYVFILCAIAAGFYLAKIQNKAGAEFVLMGIVYSIAAFTFYGVVAGGLLFVGCIVALSASQR